VAAAWPAPLSGQAGLGHGWNLERNGLWVEWQKPSFKDGEGLTFTTSVVTLGAAFKLARGASLIAELPYAHAGYDQGGVEESGSAVGNPYLGVRYAPPGAAFSPIVELGARLPLAREDPDDAMAQLVGAFTDFERFEAFLPKVTTFRLLLGGRTANPGGAFVRLLAGPSAVVPTGDSDFDETEVYLGYSVQSGVALARLTAAVAFSGRAWLTSGGGCDGLGECTIHLLTLSVGYRVGSVEPMAFVRVPLDEDLSDALNNVVGLGLTLRLP
jgi:hypothetical protein